MKKHLHWEFIALDLTKGTSYITVTDKETEEDALEVAKQRVIRSVYLLNRCWECVQCGSQEELVKSQAEYFKRIIKTQGLEKKPWEKDDS